MYPPLTDIRKCSLRIATYIAEHAYKTGLASTYPEPADKQAFVSAQLYEYAYRDAVPSVYKWSDA